MDILNQGAEEERTQELTPELVEHFLAYLLERGRSEVSVKAYRKALAALSSCLPEERQIGAATGVWWRGILEEQGASPRTVSARMSAWNSLARYLGHRDWQVEGLCSGAQDIQPELTRKEYLRLLSAAKQLGQERAYLLIKALGGVGLKLQELPRLTAEAVRAGVVGLDGAGSERIRILHLPTVLQQELVRYMDRHGIRKGPVFVTSGGRPMDRSNIGHCIKRVSGAAHVSEEKVNPRCLWRMYLSTQKGIRDNVALLVEQAYERQLEKEQMAVGWEMY